MPRELVAVHRDHHLYRDPDTSEWWLERISTIVVGKVELVVATTKVMSFQNQEEAFSALQAISAN